MSKVKIKICGLKRMEDIRAVNDLKPDYIGFVFARQSHRFVTDEEVRVLREQLDPGILPVGVFVNEDPARVAGLLEEGILAMAQLHGQEDEAYVYTLRQLTDRPLIKAISVSGWEDIARANAFPADYILLDHGAGGSGRAFDWSLSERMQRPYFLAGGLHAGNVREALRDTHPFAVDVSSGVETERKKDIGKMRDFIRAVREQDTEMTGNAGIGFDTKIK